MCTSTSVKRCVARVVEDEGAAEGAADLQGHDQHRADPLAIVGFPPRSEYGGPADVFGDDRRLGQVRRLFQRLDPECRYSSESPEARAIPQRPVAASCRQTA